MSPPDSSFIFAEFACADAVGVILGHSLQIKRGEQIDLRFRKGHLLTDTDVLLLQEAGVQHITGARLGTDDIAENTAADEIARLLIGSHTTSRPPHGGRCNLHADRQGILVVDVPRIIDANCLDESIAIGTLPPGTLVRKGQVVATVKIIPCAIPRRQLNACRARLDSPPLRIAELSPRRAALIVTTLPGAAETREKSLTATRHVTRQRLESLGSRLALELKCRHELTEIANAIEQANAAGCDLILISGAAGTKDRRDVVPSAILASGGRIERFGIPVEPGNMLLLAYHDKTPILVLPGCARSRRLNGLDEILQRLLADLPLNAADFAAMGIGGLIRHAPGAYPESAHEHEPAHEPPTKPLRPLQQPRIAALILAAGCSQRMAGRHKLLESIDGIPLIQRTLNAARASRAHSISIVTGHQSNEIAAYATAAQIAIVHNPDYRLGMASSLRCGIAALPDDIDAVLVMLADMPYVNAKHLDRLIDRYTQHAAAAPIIVPTHEGRRGNPVIWPRRLFAEIMTLEGDQGARTLIARHTEEVLTLDLENAAIWVDIDTPEDLIKHGKK